MLSIEHFSKTYPGGKRAVEDLNLTIQAGEICGFIGHNGAGKTTTLRAVAGVMAYSEGTIRINGIDLHTDPVAAKKVMAFPPPCLFPQRTVFSAGPGLPAPGLAPGLLNFGPGLSCFGRLIPGPGFACPGFGAGLCIPGLGSGPRLGPGFGAA